MKEVEKKKKKKKKKEEEEEEEEEDIEERRWKRKGKIFNQPIEMQIPIGSGSRFVLLARTRSGESTTEGEFRMMMANWHRGSIESETLSVGPGKTYCPCFFLTPSNIKSAYYEWSWQIPRKTL
ncbi:hypothetical protein V1477_020115 [Vespula maculifrons]|uniref:Uncharacterized protein n=1 Tax=Vespula maculifrons TaxID=7453 RepID=A0ABD2ANT0_VESMC